MHDRWGSNEESGSSLHLNLEDFEKFHQRYLSKYTKNDLENSSHIPRKPRRARISSELFDRLLNSELGLSLNEEEDPKMIAEGQIVLLGEI